MADPPGEPSPSASTPLRQTCWTFWTRKDSPKFIFWASATGGNIALTFALAHQERLKSLILNGADLDPVGVKLSTQIPIILGYYAACLAARLNTGAIPKMELLRLMVKEPHIPPEALDAIRVPTLVIAGTNDMIREDHTRLIHQHIPGSRLALIPGDHFIAKKNSEAFNRAVDTFLKELSEGEHI